MKLSICSQKRALLRFYKNEPYANVAFQKLYDVPVSVDILYIFFDMASFNPKRKILKSISVELEVSEA